MSRSAPEIEEWLIANVSRLTGTPAAEIDPDARLERTGLDSVGLVTLAVDLETWLGIRLGVNVLDVYPSVRALARFLAEKGASCP